MNSTTAKRPTSATSLRVTDAERDGCLDALKHSFEVGQLDQAEFEKRVASTLQAVVRSDLAGLMVDLVEVSPRWTRPARASSRRKVAAGVAAVVFLLVGVVGVAAGSFEQPSAGVCVATGLVTQADCPVPSATQEKLIADVEAAADAATQARAAADSANQDSATNRWAEQAQAASERAASAGRDAQAIVATAPGGQPEPGALKVPAATAHKATQDAIKAALEADAAAAGTS